MGMEKVLVVMGYVEVSVAYCKYRVPNEVLQGRGADGTLLSEGKKTWIVML